MHGDSDQTVTPQFSYHYYDALLKYGHDATFVLVPRQGHGKSLPVKKNSENIIGRKGL